MNNYETIFIMKNNLTEEQRQEVFNKIKSYLNKNGKITLEQDIGLKTLAYEIKECKQGYYYLIEFTCKPEAIVELERIYRIADEILKFIVLKK